MSNLTRQQIVSVLEECCENERRFISSAPAGDERVAQAKERLEYMQRDIEDVRQLP